MGLPTAGPGPVEVPLWRLRLLRGTYLLFVVGLGVTVWPDILRPPPEAANTRGVINSLLGAVSVLALPGLLHPLRMLPVILFELVWKTIWVLTLGVPLWLRGALEPATSATFQACLVGLVILPPVIPWRHVARHYLGADAGRRPATPGPHPGGTDDPRRA